MPEEKIEVNKVFEVGGSLAIVIPSNMARELNINKGTHLKIYSDPNDKKRIIMEVVE